MGRRPLPPKDLVAATLAEAAAYFMREAERELGRGSSIVRQKRTIVNRMLECLGHRREVWTLTVADLKEVQTYVVLGLSPEDVGGPPRRTRHARTGRHTRPSKGLVASTIRQFTKECHENKWLPGYVDLPRPTFRSKKSHTGETPPPPPFYISREEFPEWLDVADQRHPKVRIALALGFYAGRRVSASLALQVGHVNRRDRTMLVYERKTDDWLTVPISTEMEYELDRWWRWATDLYGVPRQDWYLIPNRKSVADIKGPGSRAPFLRNPNTWPVIMTEATAYVRMWEDVRIVMEQFGIKKGIGAGTHTFRRSGAKVVDKELGQQATQVFLSHKSPISTQVYTRNMAAVESLWESMTGDAIFTAPGEAEVIQLRPDVGSTG